MVFEISIVQTCHYFENQRLFEIRVLSDQSKSIIFKTLFLVSEQEYSDVEKEKEKNERYMVITVSVANIREDAGTENNIVSIAYDGTVFVGTGEEKKDSNGDIWYEIYLDEEKKKTGWASEIVIKEQK